MNEFMMFAALAVLASLALSLIRIVRGPTVADRMMAAQLMGTSGVAVLLILGEVQDAPDVLDVALVLALLSGFAAVAFVKTRTADGAGDPEAEA